MYIVVVSQTDQDNLLNSIPLKDSAKNKGTMKHPVFTLLIDANTIEVGRGSIVDMDFPEE